MARFVIAFGNPGPVAGEEGRVPVAGVVALDMTFDVMMIYFIFVFDTYPYTRCSSVGYNKPKKQSFDTAPEDPLLLDVALIRS